MPVYRVTEEDFEPLEKTSFENEGLLERKDIQARLRDRPEILEEGLYILAEEFGSWEESSRRIDLLALDGEGRLVVIELKRSDQDSFMDLQAIRYAGMIAGMTLEQAAEAHRRYLEAMGQDPTDAASRIQQQITGGDAEVELDSHNPRVILVSGNFSKELTSSVIWLNRVGMNVTCVKLELYRSGNHLYLEGNRIIPLPEAEDFRINIQAVGRPGTGKPPTQQPITHPGGDEFRRAAETAKQDAQELLIPLHELAISLEEQRLASVSTKVGSYNTVLRVRLPGNEQALFFAYRNEPGWGYMQFSGRSLERYAPRSKERLERIIDKNIGPQSTFWSLPEGLLKALGDAYREAAGLELEDDNIEEHPAQPGPAPEVGEEDGVDIGGELNNPN